MGSCGSWYCELELGSTLAYCSATEGIAEPKEWDRSISGGERSEETVRRLVGGDLFIGVDIVCRSRNTKFAGSNWGVWGFIFEFRQQASRV
jgi:hypothetical protein